MGGLQDSYGRYEVLGRMKKRAVPVLKPGVARFDGEPVDRGTGIVLEPEEAYETLYTQVKEEPLGTVARVESLATLL